MDVIKVAKHFEDSAKRDLKTAEGLFSLKRFDACLFFCHLALEKIIKGLVSLKTKEVPPYTHDLVKLLSIAKIDLSEE